MRIKTWISILLALAVWVGLWPQPQDVRAERAANPGGAPAQTVPGNQYGYTLSEAAWDWVTADQSTGLNTPGAFAGPFNLGFTFRYYGRAYTQVNINGDGFISFSDNTANPFYRFNTYMPKYTTPNNIIAPMWNRFKFKAGGGVRYGLGGTSPNRYFVVEWVNMVDDTYYGETVWFEVLLYENGDIKMQYFATPSVNYFTSGIEDETGWDGLQIGLVPLGQHSAFLFTYPQPAARPRVVPAYQAAYNRAGQPAVFNVEVLNAGDLGNDTFDLSASSSWLVSFFAADGVMPLSDSDSDGKPDTGPLATGASRVVVVKVGIPNGVQVGANTNVTLAATSSINTAIQGSAQLHAIVPASFAQVFTDMGDDAMYLDLVEPGQRQLIQAAPGGTNGYEGAVAAQPNGNLVYAWGQGETCFTMLDKTGATLRPPACLTDLSGEPDYTWEAYPAVASLPDGKIALFWMRQYSNYNVYPWTVLANLYLAVLNADGSLAYGPANLTNNVTPTPWNTGGRLYYKNLGLAALGADRFALAWEQESMPAANQYVNDIYIAVRLSSGAEITPTTRITYDTPSSLDNNTNPNLAGLENGRALLSWYTRGYGFEDVNYAVLNNTGALIKPITNLTPGDTPIGGYPDAVRLNGGNILVAWPLMEGLAYALLNSSYDVQGAVHILLNPLTTDYNQAVSVTGDSVGNAILTWSDFGSIGGGGVQRRPFIFYALLSGSGEVLTPPAILLSDRDSLDSSLTGFGVAPHAGSGVDVYVNSPALAAGRPGEPASLGIQAGNQGGGTATQVQLTATLGAGLTYLQAVPAPSSVNGQTLTWNLADLPGGVAQTIFLQVRLPVNVALGTLYPVAFTVSCGQEDVYTGNNTRTSQVMAALPVFLPLIRR